jgi:hypothetical protein
MCSQVAEQLIKRRKILPAALARELLDAINERQKADYKPYPIGRQVAERRLRKTSSFINAVKEVVK